MKKLLYLLTLAVFVFSVCTAVAGEPRKTMAQATPEKTQASVNCCLDGKCKKAASVDLCTKLGGKPVKDCKDCK